MDVPIAFLNKHKLFYKIKLQKKQKTKKKKKTVAWQCQMFELLLFFKNESINWVHDLKKFLVIFEKIKKVISKKMSFFGDKRQGWITLFPSGYLSHFDAAWSNEKLTFMFMILLNQRVLLMKRKTLGPRQFIFLQVISTARGLINDWINLILMIVLGMPRSDRVGL